MTALRGLLVAIELATRQRDDAGQALAQAVRRVDRAREQMEQLQSYATDTSARWSVASQASATPQIVGHYYQFMERLEQTIGLQQGVIQDLQLQRQTANRVLLDAELRIAGLNQVLEQRRAELAREQAQRDQKESDELAAQMHRRVAQARNTGRNA